MTTPTPMTAAEVDRAIIDAGRALTAAIRARPRVQSNIDDARAELDDLIALRASLNV